ncbi:hypothetical protein HOY82DRAFT_544186 [Tuber indicum]|nr:hypothetical protein HOY82DRAFT_544186 [Tuber indicum]
MGRLEVDSTEAMGKLRGLGGNLGGISEKQDAVSIKGEALGWSERGSLACRSICQCRKYKEWLQLTSLSKDPSHTDRQRQPCGYEPRKSGSPSAGSIDQQEQDLPPPYAKGEIHHLPKDQPISGRELQ